MEKIKVICRPYGLQNKDRWEWPTELCCRPMVGDYIEAQSQEIVDFSGSPCASRVRLRIMSITHTKDGLWIELE